MWNDIIEKILKDEFNRTMLIDVNEFSSEIKEA